MLTTRLVPFFRSWLRAHTDTQFYQAVLNWTQRQTVAFLLGAYALLALAQATSSYFITLPQLAHELTHYWNEVSPRFPENFRIAYSNRFITLEPESRLVLPFPSFLKTDESPENLLVVDTNKEVQPEKESTLIFSGYDEYVVQPSQSGKHPSALEFLFEKSEWSITRADLDNTVQEFQAQWPSTRLFTALASGLSIVALLLPWRMLVLLLYSWLGQTLLVLMGNRLRYWEAFRLGLVLLIPAETLMFLTRLLYPHQLVFEFWVIWLALLLIVSFTNRKKLL